MCNIRSQLIVEKTFWSFILLIILVFQGDKEQLKMKNELAMNGNQWKGTIYYPHRGYLTLPFLFLHIDSNSIP